MTEKYCLQTDIVINCLCPQSLLRGVRLARDVSAASPLVGVQFHTRLQLQLHNTQSKNTDVGQTNGIDLTTSYKITETNNSNKIHAEENYWL